MTRKTSVLSSPPHIHFGIAQPFRIPETGVPYDLCLGDHGRAALETVTPLSVAIDQVPDCYDCGKMRLASVSELRSDGICRPSDGTKHDEKDARSAGMKKCGKCKCRVVSESMNDVPENLRKARAGQASGSSHQTEYAAGR